MCGEQNFPTLMAKVADPTGYETRSCMQREHAARVIVYIFPFSFANSV